MPKWTHISPVAPRGRRYYLGIPSARHFSIYARYGQNKARRLFRKSENSKAYKSCRSRYSCTFRCCGVDKHHGRTFWGNKCSWRNPSSRRQGFHCGSHRVCPFRNGNSCNCPVRIWRWGTERSAFSREMDRLSFGERIACRLGKNRRWPVHLSVQPNFSTYRPHTSPLYSRKRSSRIYGSRASWNPTFSAAIQKRKSG